MDARSLAKDWKAGKFLPAYYLVGEASGVAEALSRLKPLFESDPFNFAEFSEDIDAKVSAIIADALTPPAFAPRRLIILANPKLSARARAEFVKYLEAPLETTTLVFLSEEKKVDPKDALARAVGARGAVCLFPPLREDEAQKRIEEECRRAGKPITTEAAHTLVAETGTDWTILRQELDKALLFAGKAATLEREHILQCLGYQKSLDPFALPKLVANRALNESLNYLRKMFDSGKSDDQAFKALSQVTATVSKQFRAKKMVKAGLAPEAIFKTLRLNAYYDRDYLAGVKKFSEDRLRGDLELCLEAEVALKSKAWLDPKIEMEHLLIGLCRRK